MFYPSIGTDDVEVSDGSGPKHGPWPGLKLGFFGDKTFQAQSRHELDFEKGLKNWTFYNAKTRGHQGLGSRLFQNFLSPGPVRACLFRARPITSSGGRIVGVVT